MSKEKEFKRSEYLAAVKDLISIMGLQDDNGQPLTIGAKSNADELKKFITDCMDQIDPETDKFTDATVAILEFLGYNGFSGEVDAKVEEPATKPGASDDDDWKEDTGKVLEAKIMSAKKLDALRQIINEESVFEDLVDRLGDAEFSGMQGPKNLKAEMLKMLNLPMVSEPSGKAPKKEKAAKAPKAEKASKPAKEPKPKKEKTEKAERYSRVDAAISAIRGMACPMTMSEIIDCANEAYSKETQTPLADPKHINNVPTLMVRTLNEFGILKKENGKYSLC